MGADKSFVALALVALVAVLAFRYERKVIEHKMNPAPTNDTVGYSGVYKPNAKTIYRSGFMNYSPLFPEPLDSMLPEVATNG